MSATDLVVAYNFPPFADASAVTVTKRLAEWDRHVDVVCQDLTGLRTVDPTLGSLVEPYVDRRFVMTSRPRFLEWASISDFVAGGMRRLTTAGGLESYERVYSRSMWPHSHVLAAAAAIQRPNVKWRAEFSDPLLRHVDGRARHSPPLTVDAVSRRLVGSLPVTYQGWFAERGELLHLVQALPFALADTLVFTNEQQRTVMLADLHDEDLAESALRRSEISPHPVPPSAWVAERSTPAHPSKVSIGYFGTLYPNRGFGTLVEAIRILEPSVREKLAVDLYTDKVTMMHNLIRRGGVEDVVSVKPALPYLEFLSAATRYNYLLVLDTQGGDFPVPNPFLPSKVSDYSATGRGVIAVVSPGSELDRRDFSLRARVGSVSELRETLIVAITRNSNPSVKISENGEM